MRWEKKSLPKVDQMSTIKTKTQLLGLIGNPIEQSLSPLLYNTAFRIMDLDLVYCAFTVEPQYLEAALYGMAALKFKGFNVTIPYKEAVLPFLDSIHSEAKSIGAVNTVVIDQGKLKGYNTDGLGFLHSLEEHNLDLTGKNVLLMGAGGAAKAVATALALRGIGSMVIANRSFNRGKELSGKIVSLEIPSRAVPLEELYETVDFSKIDLLVNTTPVGMYENKNSSLIAIEYLPQTCIVCDLVYGSHKSKLLKEAEQQGLKTIDGAGMLLHQAAEAFFLFTGLVPPIESMRKVLNVALCQKL